MEVGGLRMKGEVEDSGVDVDDGMEVGGLRFRVEYSRE